MTAFLVNLLMTLIMVAIWHVFLARLGWKARKILGAHFQLFPIELSIFLSNLIE